MSLSLDPIKNIGSWLEGMPIYGLSSLQGLSVDLNGKRLLIEINGDPIAQKHFNAIYTAWKMQYRYLQILTDTYRYMKKNVPQAEAVRYLNAFKEAYRCRWTKNKYCQ